MNAIKKKIGVDFEAVNVASNSDDDDGEEREKTEDMGYQQTLMYGRYSRSLGDDLREEMKRQKMLEKTHRKEFRKIKTELRGRTARQDKVQYNILSLLIGPG